MNEPPGIRDKEFYDDDYDNVPSVTSSPFHLSLHFFLFFSLNFTISLEDLALVLANDLFFHFPLLSRVAIQF